jgi:hypothetical protein
MLAQSFMSAADLEITEPQLSALQKTLVLLETGKLEHCPTDERIRSFSLGSAVPVFCGKFNMTDWWADHPCGTVACIGGTAEIIGGVDFAEYPPNLHHLFHPYRIGADWDAITPTQAATALRSYLTIGDARWDLAVS